MYAFRLRNIICRTCSYSENDQISDPVIQQKLWYLDDRPLQTDISLLKNVTIYSDPRKKIEQQAPTRTVINYFSALI